MEQPPPSDAIAYYDRLASDLAPKYDAVTFDLVHRNLVRYLPSRGRVLDIGAGSGRDAQALAARGLHVTAVEPSVAFRELGRAKSVLGITWVDDRLPALVRLGKVPPFDFILCSAVLMLINPDELSESFRTMASVLADGGHLAIDIRDPKSGEP